MKKIGIGLLGYGSIAKVHTLCYKELELLYPGKLPELCLCAVSASSPESSERARKEGGFEDACNSIDALVRHPGVDVVDCSLPNHLRLEAMRKAAEHGKAVYCEKPLARSLEEGRIIVDIIEKAAIPFGMTFNFRFVPAVLRAKQLIEAGELGDVFHFHAKYYHTGYQNRNRPFSWRLSKEKSGGGALVDMGAHIIDLMRFLVGDFAELSARVKTWIEKRPLSKNSTEFATVDVDDAAWLQVKMKNEAVGTLETSRFATGTLDDLIFDIFGSKGALHFNLMDANWLYHFDERSGTGLAASQRGWKRIETVQSYPGAATPPARSILGWTRTHAENQYRFLSSLQDATVPSPSIYDGLAVQCVLDAAYRSAAANAETLSVPECRI